MQIVEAPDKPIHAYSLIMKMESRTLPIPIPAHAESETPFVAARTPIEKRLVDIWIDVLERRQIGVHDNFFDLGGHSLLALRVIFRVQEAFHVDVSLAVFFTQPTIEQLAKLIIQLQAEQVQDNMLTGFLEEVEGLTEDEVRHRLAEEE